MKYSHYLLLAICILSLDQATKLLVYHEMFRGEEIQLLGDWLKIHYTVNPGVAFGVSPDTPWGKIGLTIFRTLAVLLLGAYLAYSYAQRMPKGYLLSITMIFSGACGNVIDSIFYGTFLPNNAVRYPGFLPDEIPFYPWFQGQVIDMVYFDLARGVFPEALPLVGGRAYAFWPIFNVADASIFVGVTILLLFHRKFFPKEQSTAAHAPSPTADR
ncbi:MAG: lipoprotein signal peptidase [Bernardetiaceae bacterium]